MAGESSPVGIADLHVHQFANLAFGGRAVWGAPDGQPSTSLASCRTIHGPHGILDVVGNVSRILLTDSPWYSLLGHNTAGYPRFSGWPTWNDLTHQQVHESLLKRAVDGGLRLMVMIAVHNKLLCRLTHGNGVACGDMKAVDLQLQAAKDMQGRIDADCGGAGRGWYRVVRSPAEARAVIASGRLAVVLGIEVDAVFDSQPEGVLSPAMVREAVEKYYDAGVRHILPLHFSNNAFGGAAFALPLQWSNGSGLVSRVNPLGSIPAYRMDTLPGGCGYRDGHRNSRGLTGLGSVLIAELMARGIVIDVDHMSAATRSAVLDICAAARYPVVAGHAEFAALSRRSLRSERQLTDREIVRIHEGGGVVAPLLGQSNTDEPTQARGTSASFLRAYRQLLDVAPGVCGGIGSDMNGFAGLPRPRTAQQSTTPVCYPFTSPVGGYLMGPAILGDRSFDINVDGVAHVGMLPDFLADLRATGLSDVEMGPLLRSAWRFVELWERNLEAR